MDTEQAPRPTVLQGPSVRRRTPRVFETEADRHDDVEDQLQGVTSLIDLMALALFDDSGRADEVLRALNRDNHQECADTLQTVRAGAHGHFKGDPVTLVRATERLTDYLGSRT